MEGSLERHDLLIFKWVYQHLLNGVAGGLEEAKVTRQLTHCQVDNGSSKVHVFLIYLQQESPLYSMVQPFLDLYLDTNNALLNVDILHFILS
jgi:hypothetical protein